MVDDQIDSVDLVASKCLNVRVMSIKVFWGYVYLDIEGLTTSTLESSCFMNGENSVWS